MGNEEHGGFQVRRRIARRGEPGGDINICIHVDCSTNQAASAPPVGAASPGTGGVTVVNPEVTPPTDPDPPSPVDPTLPGPAIALTADGTTPTLAASPVIMKGMVPYLDHQALQSKFKAWSRTPGGLDDLRPVWMFVPATISADRQIYRGVAVYQLPATAPAEITLVTNGDKYGQAGQPAYPYSSYPLRTPTTHHYKITKVAIVHNSATDHKVTVSLGVAGSPPANAYLVAFPSIIPATIPPLADMDAYAQLGYIGEITPADKARTFTLTKAPTSSWYFVVVAADPTNPVCDWGNVVSNVQVL